MPYEEDIRAALRARAGQAPDAQGVLTAIRERQALQPSAARGGRRSARPNSRPWPVPSRRRIRVLAAPAAATVAVVAVIVTSIALSGGTHVSGPATANPGATVSPRDTGPGVPPYYMTSVVTQLSGPSNKLAADAVIRETATGKAVATVQLPKPDDYIAAITGAADDMTFVLAAQATQKFAPTGAVVFFLARFDPADLKVSVTALPIPSQAGDHYDGLALSPDGTQLALAITTGGPSAARTDDDLMIYSLSTGQVKAWTGSGAVFGVGSYFADPEAISWSSTGELAFNWITGSPSSNAVWVLNTTTPGGSLLGHSKFIVRIQNDAGWGFNADGILTLDGTKIVAPMWQMSRTRFYRAAVPRLPGYKGPVKTMKVPMISYEFEEFSVATGRPVSVTYQTTGLINQILYWADPSGRVLVVGLLAGRGRGKVGSVGRLGTVARDKFTPLRGVPPGLVADGSIAF